MVAGCFLGFVILHLLITVIISFFVDKRKEMSKVSTFYRFWTNETLNILFNFARVRLHVTEKEKLPDGKPFYLVSNHRSNFDALICMVKLREYPLAFISKPENFEMPIVGAFLHKCGFLPIDRENPRNALKTINNATAILKSGEMSIGIYPEGTRNRTDMALLPFKSGAFKPAQDAGMPIVVMTVKNTEKIARNFPLRHTDVYLDIAAVLSSDEISGIRRTQVGETVRTIMLDSLRSSGSPICKEASYSA